MLIGLASSGVHSNGYSLVRKLFGDENREELNAFDERLGDSPLNVLLTPTRIYVKSILNLIVKVNVKGIAHITGGGFFENIPRIFPAGIGCEIDKNAYEVPPVFKVMQEKAGITDAQIYNTFNMGVGMVVCIEEKDVAVTLKYLTESGEKAFVLGKTVNGKGVTLL